MSETEPTDPLAELREIARPYGGNYQAFKDTAFALMHYVTDPSSPDEIAAAIARSEFGRCVDSIDQRTARAVINHLAEKALRG